jgi:hypothetical protein
VRRGDQAGDLGGDVGWREAGVFLPAFGAGASAPLSSESRGKLPSGCWVRSYRNRTMAWALARSPSASSPVNVS